jgi:hypothetical protein
MIIMVLLVDCLSLYMVKHSRWQERRHWHRHTMSARQCSVVVLSSSAFQVLALVTVTGIVAHHSTVVTVTDSLSLWQQADSGT